MIARRDWIVVPVILVVLGLGAFGIRIAVAHCDGLDGPVVRAARSALEHGARWTGPRPCDPRGRPGVGDRNAGPT